MSAPFPNLFGYDVPIPKRLDWKASGADGPAPDDPNEGVR
jgi:hypothetical protein